MILCGFKNQGVSENWEKMLLSNHINQISLQQKKKFGMPLGLWYMYNKDIIILGQYMVQASW